MKIKYRITLAFIALVMSILLMLCFSTFYLSSINRQNQFIAKLKANGLTTAKLLINVSGLDKELLRKIEQENKTLLYNKSITIYDENANEIYIYYDQNTAPVPVSLKDLKKTDKGKDNYLQRGLNEVIIFKYNESKKDYYVVSAACDKEGYNQLSKLKYILFISFFLGSILALIIGIIFSTRLIAPIKKISSDINEISSQNLSKRIIVSDNEPDNELNELSRILNQLIDRLEESFEIQTRFIANASHELSTPLMSISSQLEVALQNERSSKEYKEVISSVYEDVKILVQLTKSLLEIAIANGTKKGTDLSFVRIDEIIMKIPAEIKAINNQFKVGINFNDFPENEEELNIFGNGELLYSAFRNVILNACKYSDNYLAEVTVSYNKNEIITTVNNKGTGINNDEKELIFEPFYRSPNMNNIQGFGIGLALTKKIIKIHKGTIEFKRIDGVENSFIIRIPLVK